MKTMIRIQTRLTALLTAALLATTFSAQAQDAPENYAGYPQAFITLQGGAQETGTHYYNNWKLITPTASVGVGVHFTPIIGARLHVNGIWNKSGVKSDYTHVDAKFKYKYVTTDLDAMVNVINLFSQNKYRPVNLYFIGGIGLDYAWDNEIVPALSQYITTANSRNRLSHNFRLGGMLDVRVARNWSINLELDANSLSDRFNSKINGTDDWQATAQLGVTYRFGLRKSSSVDDYDIWHRFRKNRNEHKGEIDPTAGDFKDNINDPVVEEKPVVVEKPVVEEKPVVVPEPKDIRRDIFFSLRETDVTATEETKLAEVAKWLNEHPTAKVTVTGYADAGTGTPAVNARYAKQRAESVTKMLTKKYKIKASRITTDSKGDTVQPFKANNDLNRVTIVIGKE